MRTASILRKATFGAVLVAAAIFATLPVRGADKRIVLIAGRPSHPAGMHEFRAGSLLLQKALSGVPGIKVDVYDMGWPAQDGRRRPRRRQLAARQRRCRAHLCRRRQGQSRDPGRADEGDRRAGGEGRRLSALPIMAWTCPPACRAMPSSAGSAGYYETNWSVNPMWKPDFQKFPTHPDDARRRAVRDSRRVVLQHALDAGRGDEEAASRRFSSPSRATRCARAHMSARGARTTTSSRPAAGTRR